MQNVTKTGKIFYGLSIAAIGVLQFVFPWFRPVLLPIPAESTQGLTWLVYLTGAALVVVGMYIATGRQIKEVALALGWALLLFFVFGHLPNRLLNHPSMLGAWTDAFKLLALSGGAFMIARIFPGHNRTGIWQSLYKITPYGRYFFGIMLFLFGIDHFLYLDFVKTLVPAWIPGPVFWTYFSGVALMGGGLAMILNFKPAPISLLLAGMLFLWLILLHIPRALIAPMTDNGNEWTSVFQCLAFTGMALLWPYTNDKG